MLEKYIPGKKQVFLLAIIGVALWLVLKDKLAADIWLYTSGGLIAGGGFLGDLAKARVNR